MTNPFNPDDIADLSPEPPPPSTAEAEDVAVDLTGFPSVDELTDAQLGKLVRRPGQRALDTSPFYAGDGLHGDWETDKVYDRGEPNSRGLEWMLDQDGTARQLEQVLTLPIRAADHTLVGGSDEGRRIIEENFPEPQRARFIAQQTSAIIFRKAFFELDWRLDDGAVRLGQAPAFRPAIACEALFNRATGAPDGFRKRVHDPGGRYDRQDWQRWYGGPMPGWIPVPKGRAHVHVHGQHRHPLKGISDMSVCWWAYESRKKLMFLWMQYIERAVAPKVGVYGKNPTEARANAEQMAKLRAGGFAPMTRPDEPSAKAFEVLEVATSAGPMFEAMSRFLEAHMVDSCLAGFTKLSSGAATGGQGSMALSNSDTATFMRARQAVADEQALSATTDIFAPLCVYNGLSAQDVPQLRIRLAHEHTDAALDLAKTLMTAGTVNAPDEFLDGLIMVVAPVLGLDADKLTDAVSRHRTQQQQQREQMMQAMQDGAFGDQDSSDSDKGDDEQGGPNVPGGLPGMPGGLGSRPGAPTIAAANRADEIDAAWSLVETAQRTGDPDGALDALLGRPQRARTHIDLADRST